MLSKFRDTLPCVEPIEYIIIAVCFSAVVENSTLIGANF